MLSYTIARYNSFPRLLPETCIQVNQCCFIKFSLPNIYFPHISKHNCTDSSHLSARLPPELLLLHLSVPQVRVLVGPDLQRGLDCGRAAGGGVELQVGGGAREEEEAVLAKTTGNAWKMWLMFGLRCLLFMQFVEKSFC